MSFILSSKPAAALSPPRNIHLTWEHNDTAHTIVITWQTTDYGTGDNVLYDTTSHGGNKFLYSNMATGTSHTYTYAGGYVHDVELTGLSPDTTYYFICGGENGGYSSERSFHTAPVDPKTFTFVVGGDSRSGSSDWPASRNDVSIAMAKHNPSFVLHVGDMVQNGDTDQSEWDNWLTDVQLDWVDNNGLSIPIIPAIGNHEGNGTIYFGQFALPDNERWYSLDWGPDLHITVLSTQDSITGSQLTWLQQDLAGHENTAWKIVIFHEPPYTSGAGHDPRYDIQQYWDPLFDNYHVNLVVCGHVHDYERTFPIYDNKVVESPFEGTVYFVSGGWGAPLSASGSAWWTAYSQSTYNFMTVEVVENKALHIKTYDRSGSLIDSYDIAYVVNLLGPGNGIATIDNTPTFTWENFFVADNYEIWVANNPSFTSPVIEENTTDNTFTTGFPLPPGDYWWKVRAYIGGENQPFSTTWTFNIYVSTGYWWNTNWTKRRLITVGPHPENYQIKVVIPSDIPRSDYPSIRFLENAVSGPLPYWIENCDNGSNTSVLENVAWVRRLENDDNTIYMYYHNANATKADNGDNVFMFFDDFGGGTGGQSALNLSKWGPSATGVDVYQTVLRLEDYSNNDGFIEHGGGQGLGTVEENTKRIIEFRIKNSSTWRGGVSVSGPSNSKLEAWGIYPNGGTAGQPPRFFSNGNWGTFNIQGNVWYIGNLIFYGDNATNKNRIGPVIYYGNDNANYRQLLENDLPNISLNWAPGASNTIDKYKPWVWDSGGTSSYYYDWFFVRKWAAADPSVTVGSEENVAIKRVNVSISPSSQIGNGGAALAYTVTITNTGNVSDNYSLTVSDNASPSWSPNVSQTSLVVAPSTSDNTTTLNVTIPDNAVPGTIDNLTVTATSQTDNTVSALASCTSQVMIVRGVSVSISPSSGSGANGATLTYTLTVNNTGNVSDNYAVVSVDNSSPSWSPSILPTSFVVPAFGSDNATLSVTVPSGAGGGTIDNIRVTVIGTGDNASASCTAQVNVFRNVSVSISPSSQSGANGATLDYAVTINNIGNVSDNYSLSAADNENWSPDVALHSLVIAAFSSENTTLVINVPLDAADGTIDNTIVTAVGTGVSNISSCTATATQSGNVEFSLGLFAGWNLVDFPVDNSPTTPSRIFTGLTFLTDYVIYSWNAPSGPYLLVGSDENLKDNVGYWVWIDTNRTLTWSGTKPASRDVHLVSGWNLVGFPIDNSSTNPSNIFTGLTYLTDYLIYHWNKLVGYSLQGASAPFEDNTGYWAWIDQAWTVTVP